MTERPSDVALFIALEALDQIGLMTKRGRSAVLARAAAVFIRTQFESATDSAPAETSERTVFLAYAFDHYECPCVPIKAFASSAEADSFVQRCNEYKESRPDCPVNVDADMTDDDYAAYEKWQTEVEEPWRTNNPAGPDAWSHDGFSTAELLLDDASEPSAEHWLVAIVELYGSEAEDLTILEQRARELAQEESHG